ncbi:MAG: restriction endonuclease subunit S [Methanocorpusculum sp.]|nr:restriction endonuclease subunit S [Methanocorpusculum sp.]
MSDWIKCSLCDIASYVTDRVNVLDLTIDTYISTENLVADRGGMIPATKLPNVNVVPSYQQNDILISNIRPYFKKIWLAHSMGGCSNDVLVIRANTTCDSKYLYYLLSTDDFFDYATKTSKGTKMPRGDKKAIMNYPVILPPLPIQKKIAAILSSLDDKIEINTRMNKVLEEIARALFHRWFVEFEFPNDEGKPYKSSGGRMIESEMGEIPEGWIAIPISNLLIVNPKLMLPKGEHASFVDMSSLPIDSCSVSEISSKEWNGGGSKFQNGDILFARITPCLENGKTAIVDFLIDDEIGFGSTEFIVLRGTGNIRTPFVYCLARDSNFRKHCIASMVGSSGRQRVQNACFGNYFVARPTDELLTKYYFICDVIFKYICVNSKENSDLNNLRSELLQRIMNCQLKVA